MTVALIITPYSCAGLCGFSSYCYCCYYYYYYCYYYYYYCYHYYYYRHCRYLSYVTLIFFKLFGNTLYEYLAITFIKVPPQQNEHK